MKNLSLKRIVSFAAIMVLFAALAGCSSAPIVGKWQTSVQGMTATNEYKADNTFFGAVTTPVGNINVSGTYKLDGDKLHETVQNVTAPSLPQQFQARLPELKKQMSNNPDSTVKFTDNDTMVHTKTVTQKTTTLTRVKDVK